MTTPSYRLEDYENTYEYHRDFRPQEVFTRNAYRLIRRISQPHVAYQSGSREMLDALDQEAVPLILPINHLSNLHDQWTAAAVADIAIPTRIGTTRVLAKDAFYNGALLRQLHAPSFLQPLLTKGVNHMGTIPVSRAKNHDNRQLVDAANKKMFDVIADLQSQGTSIALYPESTHNYVHPETLLPVRPGIGEIAVRSLQKCQPALVPIGISYGPDRTPIDEYATKPTHIRHAQAYIGDITLLEPDMNVQDIMELTRRTLQDSVDHAHELYLQRAA